MAINVKCSFLYNVPGAGWSETFYLSQIADLASAKQPCLNLLGVRAKLLATEVQCVGVRLSTEGTANQTLVFVPSDKDMQPRPVEPCDTPWNAGLLRLNAAGVAHRSMYLRGLPDSWVTYAATATGLSNVAALATNFINSLIQNKFCIKSLTPPVGVLPKPITQISITQNLGIQLTSAGHGLVTGGKIRIKNVGNVKPTINGKWQVDVLSATDFLIAAPGRVSNYLGGGVFTPVTYNYAQVTDGQCLRVTKKNTGRSFFQYSFKAKPKK